MDLNTIALDTTSELRKGDLLGGQVIESIKVGPKWTEVRDANGKLIIRCSSNTKIDVQRWVKTEAELEAEKAKMQAEYLARREETFSEKITHAVSGASFDAAVAEYAKYPDYSRLTTMMEAAALKKAAESVLHIVEHTAKPETEAEPMTFIDAITHIFNRANENRFPRSPLNRSTSTTSNLIEDLDRWAIEETFHRHASWF